ncbi:PhzF family phenazine biosynthesis protein [Cytophagaceae bacterium ABcell3]|nr:PhzF family phenazine biosynthesis protein [Cytophagaceae bacterium ABcell3]
MKLTYYHVDAFSSEPFKGNPAAVCVTDKPLDDVVMQKIAAEFNLPASTFLYRDLNGWHIRWYAPGAEIKLCGHGSIAAAKVLYEEGIVPIDNELVFVSRDQVEVLAQRKGEKLSIKLPVIPAYEKIDLPDDIKEAFDAKIICATKHQNGYLLQLGSEQEVRGLVPNFHVLAQYKAVFIVTAKGVKDYDFVSRVFVPFAGINEDPVTGSAHACLASFWSNETGRDVFKAFQASARGGVIGLQVEGDHVTLSSEAYIMGKGYIAI